MSDYGPCPKCGTSVLSDILYVPYMYSGGFESWDHCMPSKGCDEFDREEGSSEHLHVTCGTCSYTRAQPTKDSKT
jgi:predicted nucleic-acid-binding Zn-ribbon protein